MYLQNHTRLQSFFCLHSGDVGPRSGSSRVRTSIALARKEYGHITYIIRHNPSHLFSSFGYSLLRIQFNHNDRHIDDLHQTRVELRLPTFHGGTGFGFSVQNGILGHFSQLMNSKSKLINNFFLMRKRRRITDKVCHSLNCERNSGSMRNTH